MSIQIIDRCETDESDIKTGYIFHGFCATGQPGKIYFGGVFEKGNLTRSYLNLVPTAGPVHGSLTSETLDVENVPVYNYLTSLIPGLFPSISGPWSPQTDQEYYNLTDIQDAGTVCKILGLGSGNVTAFKVGLPEKSALSTLSENFNIQSTKFAAVNELLLAEYGRTPLIKQLNYSNVTSNFIYPLTTTGAIFYMQGFNWQTQYGITTIKGTNDFPTFAWGGGRRGTLTPRSVQFKGNTLFNYPSSYLENELDIIPTGYIYAGQGIQLSQNGTIQPYQQGRGITEYITREARYENGVPIYVDLTSTFPPEGAVPGRNNAFIGIALTDNFKDTFNIVNLENSSTTIQDTRKIIGRSPGGPNMVTSNAAHNAPLVYFPDSPEVNSYNPLPWNSLFAYISNTTSSSSNERTDKVPILREGITTMVIGGAYPLYRGTWASEFSGYCRSGLLFALELYSFGFRYFGRYASQYYITNEFWKADEVDNEPTPELVYPLPVPPNSPYIIKGGRIVLYSGQKVVAGSYVYSTIGLTGNVNISKFFGPGAKEILLNSGERDYLIQSLYGKYQSNQGGLIVIVVNTDESDPSGQPPIPPMPPSGCQPIGIILETIEGYGEPQVANLQTTYARQTTISSDLQTVPDFETVYQLQNREVMIQIFPMYANQSLSGYPSTYRLARGIPSMSTVASDYLLDSIEYYFKFIAPGPPVEYERNDIVIPGTPMNARIRTLYTIQDGKYAYNYRYQVLILPNAEIQELPIFASFKDKQLTQDWSFPQYFKFSTISLF